VRSCARPRVGKPATEQARGSVRERERERGRGGGILWGREGGGSRRAHARPRVHLAFADTRGLRPGCPRLRTPARAEHGPRPYDDVDSGSHQHDGYRASLIRGPGPTNLASSPAPGLRRLTSARRPLGAGSRMQLGAAAGMPGNGFPPPLDLLQPEGIPWMLLL
jgi:hypothetical protein